MPFIQFILNNIQEIDVVIGKSFYYFVICMNIGPSMEEAGDTILPILGFPSQDGETYNSYRKGRLISGNLKS